MISILLRGAVISQGGGTIGRGAGNRSHSYQIEPSKEDLSKTIFLTRRLVRWAKTTAKKETFVSRKEKNIPIQHSEEWHIKRINLYHALFAFKQAVAGVIGFGPPIPDERAPVGISGRLEPNLEKKWRETLVAYMHEYKINQATLESHLKQLGSYIKARIISFEEFLYSRHNWFKKWMAEALEWDGKVYNSRARFKQPDIQVFEKAELERIQQNEQERVAVEKKREAEMLAVRNDMEKETLKTKAFSVLLSQLGQKETGKNTGPVVEWAMSPWSKVKPDNTGWAEWCAAAVCTAYLEAGSKQIKSLASTNAATLFSRLKKLRQIILPGGNEPEKGDLVFFSHAGRIGHVGLVERFSKEQHSLLTLE